MILVQVQYCTYCAVQQQMLIRIALVYVLQYILRTEVPKSNKEAFHQVRNLRFSYLRNHDPLQNRCALFSTSDHRLATLTEPKNAEASNGLVLWSEPQSCARNLESAGEQRQDSSWFRTQALTMDFDVSQTVGHTNRSCSPVWSEIRKNLGTLGLDRCASFGKFGLGK